MRAGPGAACPDNGWLNRTSAHNVILPALFAGLFVAGCVRYQEKPLSAAATARELEGRSLSDPRFKTFLETNLHRALAEWPATNLDFPALALAAFYFHPDLDLARAQWAVARGGEAAAGARPNPVLAVTPGYSANPPRDVSPWFPSVTLDVPIETAGKRRYRVAHAQHLSNAALLNISTAAWQIRSGVRAALVDYATARQRVRLSGAHVQWQQRVTELLEQRLAAGAVGAPEVSTARLALLQLRAALSEAERQGAEARAAMASALGLSARAVEGMEFTFDLDQAPDAALLSGEVRQQALLGRADILAGLAEYAASESALQLEIAKQYPDLHFNPGYQYDQGENKWSLGLSVELPVLYRNQGGIAEAKAKRDEAAAKFTALQARVIAQIDRALLHRTAALEQMRQVEELTRLGQERVRQVETAFQAGAADQFELAGAQAEFAATELVRLDARARQQQAIGLLEDALQRPFEGISNVARDPKAETASSERTLK